MKISGRAITSSEFEESEFDKAQRLRKERRAKQEKEFEKNKPKPPTKEEIKKKEKEDLKISIEDLKKNPISEWDDEKILKEFETYPSLRCLFFNVVIHQPTMNLMIRIDMGFEESFKGQIGKQLKKLRRMGLVNEVLVCETWWKNHFNKKFKLKIEIPEIELKMLKKLKLHKDTEERKRNNLIANSGFWILTRLGERIFPIIKKSIGSGCKR